MTVMSILRGSNVVLEKALTPQNKTLAQTFFKNLSTSGVRSGGGGHNPLHLFPSRFMWNKYKDQFHFYLFLGVIPLSLVTFYANVFIGPSTLAEIPECYEPKQWEYYKSPITRWFSKHFQENMQEMYERNLHYLYEHDEKRRMRLLQYKVERLMKERGDYPNYFTNRNILSKYIRNLQLEREYIESTTGEDD